MKGKWSFKHAYAAYLGVTAVGEKLARSIDGSAEEAFKNTYGSITIEWGCSKSECTKLGRTFDDDLIKFRDFYGDHNISQMLMNTNLVIHELGHMLENIIAYALPDGTLYKPARSSLPGNLANNRDGLAPRWIHQQSDDISSGEIFADMFVGWVLTRNSK